MLCKVETDTSQQKPISTIANYKACNHSERFCRDSVEGQCFDTKKLDRVARVASGGNSWSQFSNRARGPSRDIWISPSSSLVYLTIYHSW